MAEYITKFRTDQGDKQVDYNALGNLPKIDAEIDENSGNAVQNKAVAAALKKISNGGAGGESITVDTELSESSENPVQNKVIVEALKNCATKKEIGDIETALDSIIAIQNGILGVSE